MSDDLVKRLRQSWDVDRSIMSQTDQWMTEREEAADRIEELELAVRYEADLAQQALDAREELEAKLSKRKELILRLAGEKLDLVSELAGLKVKLAKVTEELEEYKWMYEDLCK